METHSVSEKRPRASTTGSESRGKAGEMALVELKIEGRLARVTVNRPESMNAMDTEMLTLLLHVLEAIADKSDVGVVVLTGSGAKSFVAGADLRELRSKDPLSARAYAELGQKVTLTLEGMPQPVIAAVNGYALGGGCELALACDIRLCSENAVFGQPEINHGIIPGWGGTQRLARICGLSAAKELILSGRTIDAKRALELGLVSAVHPREQLLDQAHELAATIASKSSVIVRLAKEAIARAMDGDLRGGLRAEADLFALCFSTWDQREGMSAFLDKRPAHFEHR